MYGEKVFSGKEGHSPSLVNLRECVYEKKVIPLPQATLSHSCTHYFSYHRADTAAWVSQLIIPYAQLYLCNLLVYDGKTVRAQTPSHYCTSIMKIIRFYMYIKKQITSSPQHL